MAGLSHEGGHVPNRALDDDIESAQRDAAARGGIPIDDEESAARGCAGRLRGITFYVYPPRHHVFGKACSSIAVDGDRGAFVHPSAVIANMALDADVEVAVEAAGERVKPAGILD